MAQTTPDNPPSRKASAAWPVILAGGLLAIFAVIFAVQFINLSQGEGGAPVETTLTADSYMRVVNTLLRDADATRGAAVVETLGCTACHVYGVVNNIAPGFEGIAWVAAERRPPLTAAAYLYESIVHPTAFEVEGYSSQMPRNYGQLSDRDIGDMIAYLLTRTETPAEN